MDSKSYGFIIVDDYSKFTWIYFLAHKNEALHTFIKHCKKIQNEKGLTLINVRSDHGGEFENNGVVERKNQILKEMARTILCENNLPKYF